jgi:hypothetical protein
LIINILNVLIGGVMNTLFKWEEIFGINFISKLIFILVTFAFLPISIILFVIVGIVKFKETAQDAQIVKDVFDKKTEENANALKEILKQSIIGNPSLLNKDNVAGLMTEEELSYIQLAAMLERKKLDVNSQGISLRQQLINNFNWSADFFDKEGGASINVNWSKIVVLEPHNSNTSVSLLTRKSNQLKVEKILANIILIQFSKVMLTKVLDPRSESFWDTADQVERIEIEHKIRLMEENGIPFQTNLEWLTHEFSNPPVDLFPHNTWLSIEYINDNLKVDMDFILLTDINDRKWKFSLRCFMFAHDVFIKSD